MIQRKWVVAGLAAAAVSVVSLLALNGSLATMSAPDLDASPGASAKPERMAQLAAPDELAAPTKAEQQQVPVLQALSTTGDQKPAVVKEVANNAGVLGALRDDTSLDAALQGITGVEQAVGAGEAQGIGGLIGRKGTQIGDLGLGARGSGLGGGGYAEGLGGLGTKGRGSGASGYGTGSGSYGAYGGKAQAYAAPGQSAGDRYAYQAETGFSAVADSPLSTFSIDVDTASYANVRRFLQDGERPPADAVRVEELLNYFPYAYDPPTNGAPFATHAEVTGAPWAEGHRLVRIGIQGREVARSATPPRNLVFLLDVSGSMQGPDRIGLVKRGMKLLTEQLGPEDHVAMVVYAGAAGVVLEPTRGDRTAEILAAIDRLEAGGSTAGAAGIQAAYQLAKANFRKGAINRVILATDGDFNVGVSSDGEFVRMVEQERESGVFLSVLGFGRGNLQDSRMEQLADKGNGNYAYIDSYPELRKVLVEQVGGTLVTIAKDVKIQVEFNPALVASYRLIGYENRRLATRDFDDDKKDAGEIGSGHSVTALYEVVPRGEAKDGSTPLRYQEGQLTAAAQSGEMLTVKLRYKAPDGDVSKLLSFPVRDEGKNFAQASTDTRWAAAVAGYGLLLSGSDHKGTLSWAWVREAAREALGRDEKGYRAEFLGLIEAARRIQG